MQGGGGGQSMQVSLSVISTKTGPWAHHAPWMIAIAICKPKSAAGRGGLRVPRLPRSCHGGYSRRWQLRPDRGSARNVQSAGTSDAQSGHSTRRHVQGWRGRSPQTLRTKPKVNVHRLSCCWLATSFGASAYQTYDFHKHIICILFISFQFLLNCFI
jgi:hypothetical protein